MLPVLGSGRTIDIHGTASPTVVVDADDVPAVADLARVHAVEGIGDIRTEAIREGDMVALGVRITSPVQSTFVLAFEFERHRAVLADAADVGHLVIAHTDPTVAARERPLWLAIDLDGDALRAAIGLDQ